MRVLWRREEDRFLKNNFERLTYREMAEKLGRTMDAVKQHCYQLGLLLPQGCMADNERDNAYMQKVWREING